MEIPAVRLTPTNSAIDSDGATWGISGNSLWFVLVGAVLSAVFWFVLWQRTAYSTGTSALVAALPLIITVGFALFRQTHSPGYATDLVDTWVNGPGFGPSMPSFDHVDENVKVTAKAMSDRSAINEGLPKLS